MFNRTTKIPEHRITEQLGPRVRIPKWPQLDKRLAIGNLEFANDCLAASSSEFACDAWEVAWKSMIFFSRGIEICSKPERKSHKSTLVGDLLEKHSRLHRRGEARRWYRRKEEIIQLNFEQYLWNEELPGHIISCRTAVRTNCRRQARRSHNRDSLALQRYTPLLTEYRI